MPRCTFLEARGGAKKAIKESGVPLYTFNKAPYATSTTPHSPSYASNTSCTMPSNPSGLTFSLALLPSVAGSSFSCTAAFSPPRPSKLPRASPPPPAAAPPPPFPPRKLKYYHLLRLSPQHPVAAHGRPPLQQPLPFQEWRQLGPAPAGKASQAQRRCADKPVKYRGASAAPS